jgi:uncharacterized protein YjbJ (UPF0337 family)
MNSDQLAGKWQQMKGEAKVQWGKLTDDDLMQIGGQKDKLIGKVQERYGYAKEEAQRRVDDWINATASAGASMKDQQNKQQNKQPNQQPNQQMNKNASHEEFANKRELRRRKIVRPREDLHDDQKSRVPDIRGANGASADQSRRVLTVCAAHDGGSGWRDGRRADPLVLVGYGCGRPPDSNFTHDPEAIA